MVWAQIHNVNSALQSSTGSTTVVQVGQDPRSRPLGHRSRLAHYLLAVREPCVNSKSTSNTPPLILALTFVAGAAASCARIEADVSDAQVTKKAVNFQGIPGRRKPRRGCRRPSRSRLPRMTCHGPRTLNAEVLRLRGRVQGCRSGPGPELHPLRAHHHVRWRGGLDTPAVEIINYQRPDHVVASPLLQREDHVSHRRDQAVGFQDNRCHHANSRACFPMRTWSADVTLDLGGKISYKL